jgi:hypothetical protein
VDPGTYPHADLLEPVDHRQRGTDRPGGAVERREERVAGRVHLGPAETVELTAHDGPVALERALPAVVTGGRGPRRRPDDVGEQDRREHPVVLG